MKKTPTYEESQQELFNYLSDELGAIALQSQMQDIERIILNSENTEIVKLQAIQQYLLERGANDEAINDSIREMKGL